MKPAQRDQEPDGLKGTALYGAGAFCGAVIGAVLGGLSGFFLPEPYYQLTNPDVLKDGQWGMIYLLTIPVGLVLGILIGAVLGLLVAKKGS